MNKHVKIVSLLINAALAVTLAGQAAAQAKSAEELEIEKKFKAADKNKDGKLTLEEAKSGMPRVAANFERLDVEKKGFLTEAQIKAIAASR